MRSSSSSRSWRRTRSSSALACSSSLSACCCFSAAPLRCGFFQLLQGFLHLLLSFFQAVGGAVGRILRLLRLLVAVFIACRRWRAGLARSWRRLRWLRLARLAGLAIGGLAVVRFAGRIAFGGLDRRRMVCRIWSRRAFACRRASTIRRHRLSCHRSCRPTCRLAFRWVPISCRPCFGRRRFFSSPPDRFLSPSVFAMSPPSLPVSAAMRC